ncbi:prepilin peptidase [Candidatus Uhrbacteria bacterium]|nr:prepilin peptidase [Candidatus Uhrbacteria bacterium]
MIILVFIIGLAVGSFLNVYIMRTYEGRSPIRGRSKCDACQRVLGIRDLIPIFSYIIVRGTCRTCSAPLTIQYPLVECAAGVLFAMSYAIVFPHGFFAVGIGDIVELTRLWFFLAVIIILFVYDWRWMVVPVIPTLVFAGIAYVLNGSFFQSAAECSSFVACAMNIGFLHYLVAGLVGALFFFVQYAISGGRWVGSGDIYLGLLFGFMVGYPGILAVLFFAYMIGAIASIVLMLFFGYGRKSAVPFGPFLAAATAIVLLAHDPLMRFIEHAFYLPFY